LYNVFVISIENQWREVKMDEFVLELEKNISKDVAQPNNKSERYRELLRIISNSNPEFKIIEFQKSKKGTEKNKSLDPGDIVFEVSKKSLNIDFETMLKYKKELCSTFMMNTIGELVIRENLDEMAQVVLGIAHDDYSDLVNGISHRNFGMQIFRDKFVFTFHISLLQKILTEDLKRKLR